MKTASVTPVAPAPVDFDRAARTAEVARLVPDTAARLTVMSSPPRRSYEDAINRAAQRAVRIEVEAMIRRAAFAAIRRSMLRAQAHRLRRRAIARNWIEALRVLGVPMLADETTLTRCVRAALDEADRELAPLVGHPSRDRYAAKDAERIVAHVLDLLAAT